MDLFNSKKKNRQNKEWTKCTKSWTCLSNSSEMEVGRE